MTLSRELSKRLNHEEEPLKKRLKLAENVFHKIDLSILRKEDLVLQWLCSVALENQSVWKTLEPCLGSTFLNIKLETKELIIQTLQKLLENCSNDSCEEILKCCNSFISNTAMQQYFINKPNSFGLLIKSLLNYILKFHERPLPVVQSDTFVAYNAAILITECIVRIFKNSSNTKEELRSVFIREILYPLCTTVDYESSDNDNRLGAAVHKCIQLVIFKKNIHILMKPSIEGVENNPLQDLLQTLNENSKTMELSNNLSVFIIVWRAAIGVSKSDLAAIDSIFRKLVDSIGRYKKEILYPMLKYLNNATLDFENKIENVTLNEYMEGIINEVLVADKLTDIDCKIITELTNLNPYMMEKKNQIILEKIFAHKNIMKYMNLITTLLNASIQLRREQKLISQFFITLKQSPDDKKMIKDEYLFSESFRKIFAKAISSFTISQSVSLLKTLMYFLKNQCDDIEESKISHKNILIIKATSELIVLLFHNVRIFEHSGILIYHQKFISNYIELGETLKLFTEKVLIIDNNDNIVHILLSLLLSWVELFYTLKYYFPKDITKEIKFPIPKEHWKKIMKNISDSGNEDCKIKMNELILHRMIPKMLTKQSIDLDGIINGLEHSWLTILTTKIEVIKFFNSEDLIHLSSLLLDHITSNELNKFQLDILKKESIQENESFIIAFVTNIFIRIGKTMKKTNTKDLIKHINTKTLMEMDSNILHIGKEIINKEQFRNATRNSCQQILPYLKIMLELPLAHLNSHIKTLTFMILFSMKNECNNDEGICKLCDTIVSELLKKNSNCILSYIDSPSLLKECLQNETLSKVFELSLRSVSSYEVLKDFIRSFKTNKKLYTFLESIENIKSTLNDDQKKMFTKAELKIMKTMKSRFTQRLEDPEMVKELTLVLKIAISSKKLDDNLKPIAESTLSNVFMSKGLVENGLQLAIVMLEQENMFNIPNEIILQIWTIMMKNVERNLLTPLLKSTKSSDFIKLLTSLHQETINCLIKGDDDDRSLENICYIWNSIIELNLPEHKISRSVAIENLLIRMQILKIHSHHWPELLKLFQNILKSKNLNISDTIFNVILSYNLTALDEIQISACKDILKTCKILITVRMSHSMDCLPTMLLIYRRIIEIIVNTSKTTDNLLDENKLKCLAVDLDKLTSSLVKLKQSIKRNSPYVIADLIKIFSEDSLSSFIKIPLENCISQWISICDQHAIAFLSRTLSTSMLQMFKMHLNIFNKFHKFSGKI